MQIKKYSKEELETVKLYFCDTIEYDGEVISNTFINNFLNEKEREKVND